MIRAVHHVGRDAAEAMTPWPDWAVVSIASFNPYPDLDNRAVLRAGWGAVLRVAFDDVHLRGPQFHGISDDDAQRIVAFVRDMAPKCAGILVHCDQGLSRSAAVARWIAGAYGLPFDDRAAARFNRHVFDTLRRVAGDMARGERDAQAGGT